MKKARINPVDFKLVPPDPEPGFDAERNKRIINWTIEQNEKNWRKKQREFKEAVRERSEAVSAFVEALKMGQSTSKVEKFFGKEKLMELKGQMIIDKLKEKARFGLPLMTRIKDIYAKEKEKCPS